MSLRWGFLGTARINDKILPLLPGSGGEAVAVASRDVARAAAYARERGIARAYGSYDELLADAAVEAVYIGLPNSLHAEWSLRALRAGKHVLCEKPLTLSGTKAEEIAAEARSRGLVACEGLMYRHHRQPEFLRELLVGGRLGELRALHTTFHTTIADGPNIRWDPEAGGGALADIGCYVTSLLLHLAGEEPVRVSATAQWTGGAKGRGVDRAFAGQLVFSSGLSAQFECSLDSPRSESLEVVGIRGILRVPKPFKMRAREELSLQTREGFETLTVEDARDPYAAQMEDFSAAVREKRSPRVSMEESVRLARTLDRLLASARG
jgi:predicted dehydrogenase